jgi:hypothetical protein
VRVFFLAGKQAGVGILECRFRRRKINAVQSKPPLDQLDIWQRRRGRWGLQVTVVKAEAVSGLIAVIATLQVTVIVPGCAPAVSKVAVEVLPVTLPALVV